MADAKMSPGSGLSAPQLDDSVTEDPPDRSAKARIKTPSGLSSPVFLMNFPLTLSAAQANNILMEEIQDRSIDYSVAFAQFMKLYQYVSRHALVYILPSEGKFQDQVYVANLGLYLPHADAILLANFRSTPRIGEEMVGRKFFHSMGYDVFRPPSNWEGEADLKFLRENIYLGGYGIRTDPRAHDWMRRTLGMEIVSVRMTDQRLYHFDCVCFPITGEKVLLATSVLSKEDVHKVEKVAEVVPVPPELVYKGLTNCVRIGRTVLYALSERDRKHLDRIEKLFAVHGLMVETFCLSEYEKSGADLSCMMMQLTYRNMCDSL